MGIALLAIAVVTAGRATSGQGASLGAFDGHGDVGSPKIAGSAVYNAVSQEYALSAGGVNMWAQRDEFQFVWKRMTGDFILQARVELLGKGVEPHRKAGWMIRQGQEADAPYVDAMVHGEGLTSLQFRRTKGAITEQKEMTIKGPDVIQLERKGGTYIFSAAKWGDPFTVVEVSDVTLGDEVLVGLALCSHNPEVTERAVFRDVRITRPAKDTFVPYRDFIGSVLEILDLETGHRQIVHSSAQPFEAPNWTPDGGALIFNRSGRGEGWGGLYRFDLATRQATLDRHRRGQPQQQRSRPLVRRLDDRPERSEPGVRRALDRLHRADRRRRAEADHHAVAVLSPQLVAGRQGSDLHRRAQQRVRHLPHPGRRQRPEVNLTNTTGLDDGPEYTRDGQYIYFNSARTGTMQMWRMKPDGKDQEQITNDEYNNWFPHISPDGKWIAIISFTKDVSATDHPYYKRVYLRLMPIDRRRAEGDCVRLRRPGNDQRAVVVARQQDAGVCQQYGQVLAASGSRQLS